MAMTGLRKALLDHSEVDELPGVHRIDNLRKQLTTIQQWRPIGVVSDDISEIRVADLQYAGKIQVIGLHYAQSWMLDGIHNSGKDSDSHLQAGSIVVRTEASRFFDRELRAVPVSTQGVSHEKDAQLVDAGYDLVHEQARLRLGAPVLAGQLMEGEYGVVAG